VRLRSHLTWTVRYLTDQLAVLRDRLTDMHAETSPSPRRSTCPTATWLWRCSACFTDWACIPAPRSTSTPRPPLDDRDPGTTRARLESLYLDRLLDERPWPHGTQQTTRLRTGSSTIISTPRIQRTDTPTPLHGHDIVSGAAGRPAGAHSRRAISCPQWA
jgi:hypothetical protein